MHKIFIIENEVNTLYALQVYFTVRGHNVYISNGTGSKRKIIDDMVLYGPDFIIIDLLLADIDGFELLKMIKDRSEFDYLPLFIYANLDEKYFKKHINVANEEYFYQKNNINVREFGHKCLKIMKNRQRIEEKK